MIVVNLIVVFRNLRTFFLSREVKIFTLRKEVLVFGIKDVVIGTKEVVFVVVSSDVVGVDLDHTVYKEGTVVQGVDIVVPNGINFVTVFRVSLLAEAKNVAVLIVVLVNALGTTGIVYGFLNLGTGIVFKNIIKALI